MCYPTLTEVNMTNATHPGTTFCCTAPHCRVQKPNANKALHRWSSWYQECAKLSAGLRVCAMPVAISGCQVAAGARCSLSHPPLSPLASGHDDWRPGARRGEQTRSAEGGGGAASVRGVTSQQSGVSRVMIPVRVVITRQMAAPSPAHRRSNIH